MPFPVTINGTVFTIDDFAGDAWIQGLPSTLDKLHEQAFLAKSWASTTNLTASKTVKNVTITAGLAPSFSLSDEYTAPHYSPFASNPIVRIWNSDSRFMDGQVLSYDNGTGVLQVDVTDVEGSGSASTWTVYIVKQSSYEDDGHGQDDLIGLPARRGGRGELFDVPTRPPSMLRHGLLMPDPRTGVMVEEEFNSITEVRARGWISNESNPPALAGASDTANELGSEAFGVMQSRIVSPMSTSNSILSCGRQGFASLNSPGDSFFYAVVDFSTDTYSSTNNPKEYIGLRGQSSSVGMLFDRYGVGFETYLDGLGSRVWNAIIGSGGVINRMPLQVTTTFGLTVLAIYVDSLTRIAHFSSGTGMNLTQVQDLNMYQASGSIETWPEEDPLAFVHPAIGATGAGSTAIRVYTDRMKFWKALER